MIRHIALLSFVEGTTDAQITALDAGLRTLPDHIDVIRRFTCGVDVGLTDTARDYAVVADFDSGADYLTYAGHPHHLAVIEQVVTPILREVVRVQYRIED
jgi:hypothetical protein